MSLDKNTLKTKIKKAFEKAKNTPPPDDPDKAGEIQEKILDDLAADLSDALEAFVKSGDVLNVEVDINVGVQDINGNPIGTAVGTAGQTAQPGNIE